MERRARLAAADIIRECASEILPRVVAEAVAEDASSADHTAMKRRLSEYLEARMPPWLEALAATDDERDKAIERLIRIDERAGGSIPPVVLLGTIAIGYRVMEQELRARASAHGHSADELWTEVDAFRRRVIATRLGTADQGEVA
jgi:hypothetical protein